jgi:hypothetical protein
MASQIRKIANRAKTIAREVRDIPTAVGTNLWSSFESQNYGPANEREIKKNANRASINQDKQVVEAINAIIKGRSGTSSDQYSKSGKYSSGKKR